MLFPSPLAHIALAGVSSYSYRLWKPLSIFVMIARNNTRILATSQIFSKHSHVGL